MYTQPQPPVRRLSTQSIHSTHSVHSTHSSPRTSPPGTAIGYQHIVVPCRQLHPPKSPLYRPAVLRAIDHVSRPNTAASSPSTSPKSMSSDMFGDLKREAEFEDDFEDAIGDDICEEEDAGRVTGPPKRAHWKPDAEATVCDSPTCIKQFSFYIRRHHCRRCGNVFCSQHAYHFLPLNQNNRVHPQGISSRVCSSCYSNYKRLRAARRTGSMSSNSTISSISNSPPRIGMGIKPIPRPTDGMAGLAGKVGSYVGSVPRDWSWSTF
ncbi:hypothetical protein BDD12DRAFT_88932 [Trichophaea hybrida]|nr:hypothetical protein BDD12DRAFT_88932 [Trichophaea hybrida]